MKIMLTSFGIEQNISQTSKEVQDSLFYLMPPVSFRRVTDTFMPDYELLLLYDSVVINEESYKKLTRAPKHPYKDVAETFKALNAEGRVELVDYNYILEKNKDLLEQMNDHDMKSRDQWIVPLEQALSIWIDFIKMADSLRINQEGDFTQDLLQRPINRSGFIQEPLIFSIREMSSHVIDALHTINYRNQRTHSKRSKSSERKMEQYEGQYDSVLRKYMNYVNSNLIISNYLNLGFHDWNDFTPFYKLKFLSVGKRDDIEISHKKEAEKLFTISFPEYAIRDTKSLLKALNDKRILELRSIISDAVKGKIEFDESFARETLKEVLQAELKIKHHRKVLGYITPAVGIVPWVGSIIQKVIEDVAGKIIEDKIKKEYRWFYMLSDIEKSNESDIGA